MSSTPSNPASVSIEIHNAVGDSQERPRSEALA